jgi:hypothetical protein
MPVDIAKRMEVNQAGMVLRMWLVLHAAQSTHATDLARFGIAR